MTRTLILNGGASVSADLQSAHLNMDDPLAFFAKHSLNSGDILVYDSILQQTVNDEIVNVQFDELRDPDSWPLGKFDQAIIRGSNYLRGGFDLTGAIVFLETLDCPIIALGVGAQAATTQRVKINEGSKRFWQIVADKSTSLGVRGLFSAEVFESIGVHNVKVIGCPSMYRSLAPNLKVQKAKSPQRFGINLNRNLGRRYSSNITKSDRLQHFLVDSAARHPGSFVYGQGEVLESTVNYLQHQERENTLQQLLAAYTVSESAPAMDMFRNRLVNFYDINNWQSHIQSNIDFMIGFRLHGCAIALAQGVPSVLFTYDTRTREMAALFQIPSIEVDAFQPIDLESTAQYADFSKFEVAYRQNFGIYRAFLEENGVRHRLAAALPSKDNEERLETNQNTVECTNSEANHKDWLQNEYDRLSESHQKLRSQLRKLKKRYSR